MEKILELAKPLINGRSNYAIPLSILGGNEKYKPWILSNLINLHFENKEDFVSFNFAEFSEGADPDFLTRKNEYLSPFLKLELLSRESVPNIVAFAVDKINENKYMYASFNKFFIPNTVWFRKHNYFHPLLIYGYNLDERCFYIKTFDADYIWSDNIVSFEQLEQGFNCIPDVTLKNKNIILYEYFPNATYTFNLPKVVRQLEQFIEPAYSSRSIIGKDIYDFINNGLNVLIDNPQLELPFARKIFHIIMEQNILMKQRIAFLYDRQILDDANKSLLNTQEMLLHQSILFRNVFLKYEMTKQHKNIKKIQDNLNVFRESQVEFYRVLIKKIV